MSARATGERGQPAREQDGNREQALFGLMAVAEEQQAAVREALAGLAAQQAALEGQQARLEQWTEAVRAEAAGLRRIAGEVGPGLARSTREAVQTAVEAGLAEAGSNLLHRTIAYRALCKLGSSPVAVAGKSPWPATGRAAPRLGEGQYPSLARESRRSARTC